MSRRAGAALVALLAIVPLARIISTYPVFSQTVDEPVHIAGGFDWLTSPGYDLDPEHPPLTRVFFALDAWLHGAHVPPDVGIRAARGNALLYRDGQYVRNLAAARAGNLPFFLAALAAVGLWTRRLFGDATALVAMALFGALPPILGHAGLATTDMGPTAITALSLYVLMLWLEAPSWRRTTLLGLTIGLGLLTKFSFVIYFPLGAFALLVASRHVRRPSSRALAVIAIAALIVWGGYKFDAGTIAEARLRTYPPNVSIPSGLFSHVPLPAPYFWTGIEYVQWHSQQGHPSFLFGTMSSGGWWYYFPVVWFFKTPLAFVLIALGGIVWLLRHSTNREAIGVALLPLLMLVPAMASGINIGIRHILPIYPILTITAAAALTQLWRWRRIAAAGIALLFVAETTLAHPDYLAWFNIAAGAHPERVANDSNLDWGQDLLRLADAANGEHLAPLYVGYFGSADPQQHITHFESLPPNSPVHGWVAISEMTLALNGDDFAWLAPYQPVRRIGRSIRLYHVR